MDVLRGIKAAQPDSASATKAKLAVRVMHASAARELMVDEFMAALCDNSDWKKITRRSR